MKSLNKKILLIIGSIISLFFVFLQTKDSLILNGLTNPETANADVIPDPGCAAPDAAAAGSGGGGCGCGGSGG